MSTKEANYYRVSRHEAEHGNLTCDLSLIEMLPGWEADDVIRVSRHAWDTTYESIALRSEGATGLTMSVGYESIQGNNLMPTAFSTDTNVAAAGTVELLNYPFEMRESMDRGFDHNLIVTLGGTVTAGDRIWLVTRRVFHGSN